MAHDPTPARSLRVRGRADRAFAIGDLALTALGGATGSGYGILEPQT